MSASEGRVDIPAAGVGIPRLGVGTFQTSPRQADVLVSAALDVGYRHVDTAMLYGNHTGVGKAVRRSSVPRDSVFVTTKIPRGEAAAGAARRAAEACLSELGLDYVDLLLLHWPHDEVSPQETFADLMPLVESGLVRAVGMSNASARLVEAALSVAPIATNQVERHPFLGQPIMHELVCSRELSLTAYAPLAQGAVFDDPVLADIATNHGKSAGQVTLRWLLDQPRTVVIPKTTSPQRLAANRDVFDFALSPEETSRIDALAQAQRRLFGSPPFPVEFDPS